MAEETRIRSKEEIDRELSESGQKSLKPKVREVPREKTFGERIADNFMNIDYDRIKDRLLFDWLFPEIISTLGDILRMIFSKDGTGRSRGGSRRPDGSRGYGSAFDDRKLERENRDPTRQDFRKIKLEFYDLEVAKNVRDELCEKLAISKNGYIPVRDLYSEADLPTYSTMLNWVWFDLDDIRIERWGENYIMIMPPAEPRPR